MADSGDEEAEEQLFAELRASAKKVAQPHPDPAARHAFLLNAARASHRHTLGPSVPSSSPLQASHTSIRSGPAAGMARRGGVGKLHPVLMRNDLAKRPRPNLARRGDPFALDISSPEKAPAKVAKQHVQAQPQKTKHKKKRTQHNTAGITRENAQDTAQETAQDRTQQNAQNDAQGVNEEVEHLAAPTTDNTISEDLIDRQSPEPSPTRDNGDPQEEEPEKRHTNPRKRKAPASRGEGKRPQRPRNKEINGDDNDAEITKVVRPRDPQVVILASERSTRQSKAQPVRDASPETVAPVRKTRTQTKKTDQDVPLPAHSKPRITRGRGRPPKHSRQEPDEPEETEQGRNKEANAHNLRNQRSDQDEAYDPPQADELSSTDGDDNEDGNETSLHEINDKSDPKTPDIVAIFEYADATGRDGDCQTEEANNIRGACQSARRLIADSDVTLEQLGEINDEILGLLRAYVTSSQVYGYRVSLKTDAYAYLFRDVSRYLRVLHKWLGEHFGDFESSLTAMRIIAPLVRSILATKDQIAYWKVKIPVRYKNDRLVKDVERDLINPLRRVDQVYNARLRILEDTVKKQSVHEKALQEGREMFAAREKKRQDAANIVVRRKHWIDLHVYRLQVESDPGRRQALSFREDYFTSMTQSREERDSNGIAFERLDVFRKRDSTPAKHSSVGKLEDWTGEQLAALVEGLTEFAGELSVLCFILTRSNMYRIRRVPPDFQELLRQARPIETIRRS